MARHKCDMLPVCIVPYHAYVNCDTSNHKRLQPHTFSPLPHQTKFHSWRPNSLISSNTVSRFLPALLAIVSQRGIYKPPRCLFTEMLRAGFSIFSNNFPIPPRSRAILPLTLKNSPSCLFLYRAFPCVSLAIQVLNRHHHLTRYPE